MTGAARDARRVAARCSPAHRHRVALRRVGELGRELFDQLSVLHAKQIYQGYGFDLATHMARQALAPINAIATGTIRVKLYKGSVHFDAASDVPHQMYSESNASMEAIGEFNHADSEGFLRVLQVSARALAANKQVVPPAWVKR